MKRFPLLYERLKEELTGPGAVLVDDLFEGSGLADLRKPTPPLGHFDARGFESIPYDLEEYLQRLGKHAPL